jgi:hypothetical protein
MGLLETRWVGTYQGREITVIRNEVSRAFIIKCDGSPITRGRRSWIGTGSVSGDVDIDGKRVLVAAELTFGGKCALSADGQALECSRVR